MSRGSHVAALLIAITVVSACSDPKAPNEANFRRVLEPVELDRYCQIIMADNLVTDVRPDRPAWPLVVSPLPPGRSGGSSAAGHAMLDAAVGAGQLTRTTGAVLARSNYTSGPMTRQLVVTYMPTAAGSERFKSSSRGTPPLTVNYPVACPAKGEIVKVVRWTDPQPAFGITISQVSYQVHGVDIDPSVPADQRAAIAAPVEVTSVLTLANDGWHIGTGIFR